MYGNTGKYMLSKLVGVGNRIPEYDEDGWYTIESGTEVTIDSDDSDCQILSIPIE